jgi:protein BCP1
MNMPPKLVPPMYTMLLEEVDWAIQDKEPYTFTHYLILSKTYKEVESKLDHEDRKKAKKAKGEASDETFYFHPEDELFHKYAVGFGNYDYTTESDEGKADSKRAFQDLGVVPQGHMILIDRGRFEEAVKAVTSFLE